MSGYGSKREVREVTIKTLQGEGRDPSDYSVAGIMRDAFTYRGSLYGYSAKDEDSWRAAVERHRHANAKPPTINVQLTLTIAVKVEDWAATYGSKSASAARAEIRETFALPDSLTGIASAVVDGWRALDEYATVTVAPVA